MLTKSIKSGFVERRVGDTRFHGERNGYEEKDVEQLQEGEEKPLFFGEVGWNGGKQGGGILWQKPPTERRVDVEKKKK